MDRLQELVRLHRIGEGAREVARLLGVSPNTERQYRHALAEAGLLEGAVDGLPECGVLREAMERLRPTKVAPQQVSSLEPWAPRVEEMVERGVRARAIFDRLRVEDREFGASLSAVKRMVKRLRQQRAVRPEDVAIAVVSKPGEIAQVDFGYVGKLYDPEQKVMRKAWVFVMVLAHSRHLFARLGFDQTTLSWVRLHVEAFECFGGVVETVVPDNLKAAVIRAAFGVGEDRELNRSYMELARHMGFKVDPAPPRAPKKKGKVEAAVKYVKRNFIATLDPGEVDIVEANRGLDRWVVEIAGRRVHGSTGRVPLEVFAAEEKPTLRALPPRRFEPVEWKQVLVHPDGQICFGRRLYPVPWTLLGQQLWARATAKTIEVYAAEKRVATHERGKPVAADLHDLYLPPERLAIRYRSRTYWVDRAAALGREVQALVEEIFATEDVLSRLRTVQAIVTHLEAFPKERARGAAARAQHFGAFSYKSVRDILRQGLDQEPLPTSGPSSAPSDRPHRYARNAQELVQGKLALVEVAS